MFLWGSIICFVTALFLITSGIFGKLFRRSLTINKRLTDALKEKEEVKARQKKKKPLDNNGPLKRIMFFVSEKYKEKLDDHLSMAGIALKAEEYLAVRVLAVSAIPSLILFFEGSIIVCFGFALLGILLPPLILSFFTRKRRNQFHLQLADALTVMCNSLRTGFSLQVAMKSIEDEMPDPISKEFARVIRETQLGMTLEESLGRMVRRTQCEDLELLAVTIAVQRQTGGNLSEILDNISQTIKERIALAGEIKLLTTTGRTSGYVIGLLPLFILAGLMILNPDYVSMFFETQIGKTLLMVAAGMEIIGFLVVKKVMDIKY